MTNMDKPVLYVGQTLCSMEVIKLNDNRVSLLCKCGEVLDRKIGSTLPQACKTCSKKVYADTGVSNNGKDLIYRDYTADEAYMIAQFQSKKQKES